LKEVPILIHKLCEGGLAIRTKRELPSKEQFKNLADRAYKELPSKQQVKNLSELAKKELLNKEQAIKMMNQTYAVIEKTFTQLEIQLGPKFRDAEKQLGLEGIYDRFKIVVGREVDRGRKMIADLPRRISTTARPMLANLNWNETGIKLDQHEVTPIQMLHERIANSKYFIWNLHNGITGFKPQDFKVSVSGNLLIIRAHSVSEGLYREVHYELSLEDDIDITTLKAHYFLDRKQLILEAQRIGSVVKSRPPVEESLRHDDLL